MVKAKQELSAIVWKEGNLFVAKTVGLELASQGGSKKEALRNLQEALDLLLEEDKGKLKINDIPRKVELNRVYA